jgi:hypothetical protein
MKSEVFIVKLKPAPKRSFYLYLQPKDEFRRRSIWGGQPMGDVILHLLLHSAPDQTDVQYIASCNHQNAHWGKHLSKLNQIMLDENNLISCLYVALLNKLCWFG